MTNKILKHQKHFDHSNHKLGKGKNSNSDLRILLRTNDQCKLTVFEIREVWMVSIGFPPNPGKS